MTWSASFPDVSHAAVHAPDQANRQRPALTSERARARALPALALLA